MKKTMFFAVAAMAMASAFADFSFAYLDTEGAKGEKTSNDTAYQAYLCTAETAATYFGGDSGLDAVTAYLAGNYTDGMDQLKEVGTAMSLYDFEDGVYTFYAPFMQGALVDGDYIAIVAYADKASDRFRVFESVAEDGKLEFAPGTMGVGTAGAWTAAAVPEPTSGMLFLLGLASLALRRKRGEG